MRIILIFYWDSLYFRTILQIVPHSNLLLPPHTSPPPYFNLHDLSPGLLHLQLNFLPSPPLGVRVSDLREGRSDLVTFDQIPLMTSHDLWETRVQILIPSKGPPTPPVTNSALSHHTLSIVLTSRSYSPFCYSKCFCSSGPDKSLIKVNYYCPRSWSC